MYLGLVVGDPLEAMVASSGLLQVSYSGAQAEGAAANQSISSCQSSEARGVMYFKHLY